jgi:hypothetical protein
MSGAGGQLFRPHSTSELDEQKAGPHLTRIITAMRRISDAKHSKIVSTPTTDFAGGRQNTAMCAGADNAGC